MSKLVLPDSLAPQIASWPRLQCYPWKLASAESDMPGSKTTLYIAKVHSSGDRFMIAGLLCAFLILHIQV
jgi:hypothetical protein